MEIILTILGAVLLFWVIGRGKRTSGDSSSSESSESTERSSDDWDKVPDGYSKKMWNTLSDEDKKAFWAE